MLRSCAFADFHMFFADVDQAGRVFGRMDFFFILAKFDDLTCICDGLYCQSKRLQFFNQHPERCRDAGFLDLLTLDDGFISIYAALHVVRFYSQHLLQRIRGTVSFKGPNFHFTKTLPTKLSFSSERLLSDQAVRSSGTGMYLVFDKVV